MADWADTDININRAVFEAYEQECARLAEAIRPNLPLASADEQFDGRAWCREHDIPTSAFADAIEYHL